MNSGWGRNIGGRLGAGRVLSGACCDAVPEDYTSWRHCLAGIRKRERWHKWQRSQLALTSKRWLWMPFATSCDGVLGSGF